MNTPFLEKIISELLEQNADLSSYQIVLPGKRPVVFIKKILTDKQYSGILPDFLSIEELITDISKKQPIQGISLWLFAFDVYKNLFEEDFSNFLKWFPTLLKDWDDILKFADEPSKVLEHMFDDERIKNWGESLGNETSEIRKRNLDFWKKMNIFLPELEKKLNEKELATSGMIHHSAKRLIENFARNTTDRFIFCGFNALTPVEELLIKNLLKWNKAQCFFETDHYYMDDEKQEAGNFLRQYTQWNVFNDSRLFQRIDNAFCEPKNIKTYEVSGNVTQTKVLPKIFNDLSTENLNDTAVVLLDENLLPACLDALNGVSKLNITMGFPLKNLAFSNAIKHLFYIQKQQEKGSESYYYNDLLAVLESIPNAKEDAKIIAEFRDEIISKNMVYFTHSRLKDSLEKLSYFEIFKKSTSSSNFIDLLINFCKKLKQHDSTDIEFENISHFEQSFKIIKNQISDYSFEIKIETLEILINQLISLETIDFKGEPLEGLQIMGLLETRLLNFKNVIMLSVNEGKLPLGNSQNTYLPYDVRKAYNLHTFLENDGIYAYHFYRLLQNAENIHLLYNALSSGVNTGEKSRFITQIEMESPHEIEQIIIENTSEPIDNQLILIEKTPIVAERLAEWKNRVSASHLVGYLYNPVQFYLNYVLKTHETNEVEEELSQRNYGNLIHLSLQFLYQNIKGKVLKYTDFQNITNKVDEALNFAIKELNHQSEYYKRGMNYIYKAMAKRTIESIIKTDWDLVKNGNKLEIIDLERKFENISFFLDAEKTECVNFHGFIDRIDRLNDTYRVIDYKTGKPKNLTLKFVDRNNNDKTETLLLSENYKQALQLCIYLYYMQNSTEFSGNMEAGIWSFAEISKGVQSLNFTDGNLQIAMISIKNLILEILNLGTPFKEK